MGMAAVETVPASHRDLLEAPIGMLATLGPKGPQASPVWFLADGDTVQISLNSRRQKARNLVASPACSFVILDLANPARYLELRGEATVGPDEEYTFARTLGTKYDADLRQMDGPGQKRLVVTLRPERVIAVDLSA